LGASLENIPESVFIDDSGNIYVTGWTRSSDFPTTPAAYDTSLGGDFDAFISKFDSDLENLLASTFLGGDDADRACSVLVSSSGDIYVAGWTSSSDFPTTPDAYDTTYNGNRDAFLSKFDSNLETLLSSSYLGGIEWDNASSLAIDTSGDVFVTGRTSSSDFPTTPGAYDTSLLAYDSDVFVSKFSFGEECPHKHKK